jgi:hypothetical protein
MARMKAATSPTRNFFRPFARAILRRRQARHAQPREHIVICVPAIRRVLHHVLQRQIRLVEIPH